MCSYPCFGLSKTGFTPPSQLRKTIQFVSLTFNKIVSLSIQKSAAKTTSLTIKKLTAESTVTVESSILHTHTLLGVYMAACFENLLDLKGSLMDFLCNIVPKCGKA
jgi:hypothetical protein